MRLLAIDTTEDLRVAAMGDGVYYEREEGGKAITSARIIPAIERALAAVKVDKTALDAIGCVVGPGSFTGIRIGVSVLNAIAYALNIPLVPITSFELMAEWTDKDALFLVNAGHGEYYGAQCINGVITDERDYTQAERDNYKGEVITFGENTSERLLGATEKLLSRGKTPIFLEPYYMKKSQAERMADNDKL